MEDENVEIFSQGENSGNIVCLHFKVICFHFLRKCNFSYLLLKDGLEYLFKTRDSLNIDRVWTNLFWTFVADVKRSVIILDSMYT